MKNRFENQYYQEFVKNNAKELVNELYGNLESELQESSQGLSFFTWYNWNERAIYEFSENISFNLKESVEILEQSSSQVFEEEFWVENGNAKIKIQNIAHNLFLNDLNNALRNALKEELENNFNVYSEKLLTFEKEYNILADKIADLEQIVEDCYTELEQAKEEGLEKEIREFEILIEGNNQEIEKLNHQLEKLEEEMENPSNLVNNTEKMMKEL